MHRYIVLVLFIGFTFWGCEDEIEQFEVSAVPTTFTKKVLIEEFTGAWCGYCPDGAYIVENLISDNAGRVIGVSVHSADAMEIAQSEFLESTYQNAGYPSGMVDRFPYDGYVSLNRGYWEYITNNQLSKTATCGLAIKSEVNGNSATVEVHAGFNNELNGDYMLTVYLIEDNVTGIGYGFDQMNFYDSDSDSPFYGLGNPIEGYEHNHTLRSVLSDPLGDVLSASVLVPGGEHIAEYTVDISAYNVENLYLVAFINFVGASFIDHEILNAQKCKIGSFQDWD